MKLRIIVVLVFCVTLSLCRSVIFAGQLQDSLQNQKKYGDAIRLADGVAHTMIAPVRWKGNDWLKAGAVIAGTALVTVADKPVRNFWLHQDGKAWDAVERAGFHYGKPYAAIAITGGFYLTGLVFKNEWARETGIVLAAAYLTSGTIQSFMKTAAGRARPAAGRGPWVFDPWSPLGGYHSFPSGHIQIAMVSAMVLGQRVNNPWLKTALYATGGTTFLSRMYSDSHWLSDLAFGSAISWFCTQSVINRMNENKQDHLFKRKKKIAWNMAPGIQGISITGTF